jgi:signal transduction histidine kinase
VGECGEAGGVVIRIDEAGSGGVDGGQSDVPRRLASLDSLTTRIAHELNNPLDGILRYTTMALRLAEETHEAKLASYLTQSRSGLVRVVQIIGELLEMARSTRGEFDRAVVNDIVQQALDSCQDAIADCGIVVTIDFQTQDLMAMRGTRLYLACCNLIRNAVDAMPDGGRLSITTGQANGSTMIQIADTGMGFAAAPEKLFEPFYTTKPPGRGTGIGLSLCKEFVEEMGGTISAELGKEGGAVFTVKIPEPPGEKGSL